MTGWDEEFTAGWVLTTRAILKAKPGAERIGARFAVLLIPYKEEVYHEVLARLFPDAPLLRSEDEASARLRAFLDAEGVAWVDATPALRQAAVRGEAIYQVTDAHLTPRGNAVVARAVEEALAASGFLDQGSRSR